MGHGADRRLHRGAAAIVALFSPWVGRMASAGGAGRCCSPASRALPIRGLLFAAVTDPYLLVAVQIFDGITAAVFSVMVPLIVADVTRGTGRFNLAQGIVGTAIGIGASLSTALAGYVSDARQHRLSRAGGVAVIGLAIWLLMPETRRSEYMPRKHGAANVGARRE